MKWKRQYVQCRLGRLAKGPTRSNHQPFHINPAYHRAHHRFTGWFLFNFLLWSQRRSLKGNINADCFIFDRVAFFSIFILRFFFMSYSLGLLQYTIARDVVVDFRLVRYTSISTICCLTFFSFERLSGETCMCSRIKLRIVVALNYQFLFLLFFTYNKTLALHSRKLKKFARYFLKLIN